MPNFASSTNLDQKKDDKICNLQLIRGFWLKNLSFNFLWYAEGASQILVGEQPLASKVKAPP